MEKVDRLRVASVFAAHTQVQSWPSPSALLRRYAHEAPHAVDVEALKRRNGEYSHA